jgi:uncharacterized protein (DUF1501 family)
MSVSRRGFIKSGAVTMFSLGFGGLVPDFLVQAAAAARPTLSRKNKVLVCIYQRGAMDGLMAVTPFKDEALKKMRPDLFLSPTANNNKNALIDLDGTFGLHPSMKHFDTLFKQKQLAIVHGVGSTFNSRSHFDAQDYMEAGTPGDRTTHDGWLNRLLSAVDGNRSPFQAVSITNNLPKSFVGKNPALAISNLKDFAIQVKRNPAAINTSAKSFEDLYDHTSSQLLNKAGKESFEAIKILDEKNVQNYRPANAATYPLSKLGNSLKQIAQLVKMDVGLEVAFAESTGWDTHFNQGSDTGVFARNVEDLSTSINAFWQDLGDYQDQVTVMTMTEFGRTVAQNGSKGTDHGRASCMFVLGKDVKGGQVHGTIKSLEKANLEDGRDLPVTTDFRNLFSEVAGKHLILKDSKALFPNFSPQKMGIMI